MWNGKDDSTREYRWFAPLVSTQVNSQQKPKRASKNFGSHIIGTPDNNTMVQMIRRWKETNNQDAIESVIESMEGAVRKLAVRTGRTPDMEDLMQVGRIGVLRAAELFDEAKGVTFFTFAFHHVRGRMFQYIRDKGRLIHIPPLKQRSEDHKRLEYYYELDGVREAIVDKYGFSIIPEGILTDTERKLLGLHYVTGNTIAESGKIMGIGKDAYRVHRNAIRKLRKVMRREDLY